jgi:hypothetical protein
MVERLRSNWQEWIVESKDRSGRPWCVGGLEEHLLVLLILYRCAIAQDFLACLYQTDQAAISRALRRIEPLAAKVLGVKRTIHVNREEAEALIIDCTEQVIQRPSRKQRCWYSGKKKRHTIKTEIIITERGKIVSTSKPAPGRVHDIPVVYMISRYDDEDRSYRRTPIFIPIAAIKDFNATTCMPRSPTRQLKRNLSQKTNALITRRLAVFASVLSIALPNSNLFAC